MQEYEVVLIFNPKLSEKEQKSETDLLVKLITEAKGKPGKVELLGKKNFCYLIKKLKEGIFIKLNFFLEEKDLKAFFGKIKLRPQIIRYLLIKKG